MLREALQLTRVVCPSWPGRAAGIFSSPCHYRLHHGSTLSRQIRESLALAANFFSMPYVFSQPVSS